MRFEVDPDREAVTRLNRSAFLQGLGLESANLVRAQLVHGNAVRLVGLQDCGNLIPETDGLVTRDRGILLGVTIADCLPVFFTDPVVKVVGIAHAGWRGLANDVLRSTVELMQSNGTNPENLRVVIGPGISPCHYEIGEEVASSFETHPDAIRRSAGRLWLDLKLVAEEQLRELGVIQERIKVSSDCTACLSDSYFSYRRDRPEHLETMLAIIGLRA